MVNKNQIIIDAVNNLNGDKKARADMEEIFKIICQNVSNYLDSDKEKFSSERKEDYITNILHNLASYDYNKENFEDFCVKCMFKVG